MNSTEHGSEEALAQLAWDRLKNSDQPRRVLIGGLGMGFTAAATLRKLEENGQIVVAELVPEVVAWNREHLGHVAGHPLQDPRVEVRVQDVAEVIREESNSFDAILLDVDNGPQGLSRRANDWLYGNAGLRAAWKSLRPDGILGVWSSGPDEIFVERLRDLDYKVEELRVRSRGHRGGAHYTIWMARRLPPRSESRERSR